MNTDIITKLAEHLAAEDPVDFAPARRGHKLTQAGDPDRFTILRWHPNVWAQLVRQERDDCAGRRPRLA